MSNISRWWEFGRKIVAIGRNYSEHAKELGNQVPTAPFYFLKPTTSYEIFEEGKEVKIELPPGSENVHHEVELGVIISRRGRDISEQDALSFVAGYCVAIDVTERDLQNKAKKAGLPWSAAKGHDTFCPVGQFVPKDLVPNLQNLHLRLRVNEEMKQDGSTKDMIFPVPSLISAVSQVMTLEEGDLLLTGTPSGVGPMKFGDSILAELLSEDQKRLSFIQARVVSRS